MKCFATFALSAASLVFAHAGSLSFDDPHPAFVLPATGTKTVCLVGTVTLQEYEKDPALAIELDPALYGGAEALPASIDPAFASYLGANRFAASYRGPILDFTLKPTTAAGDYTFGDGIYPPFVYFGYGRYEPPEMGGVLLGTESYKVFYSVDVRPVPEPATLAALAAGALIAGHRRRR